MANAKEELLVDTRNLTIKCAEIWKGDEYDDERVFIDLKVGYSKEDWESFLKQLDFKYDAGYGKQKLYGTVWLDNGEWLDRDEYDGSEWWVRRKVPAIPERLLID